MTGAFAVPKGMSPANLKIASVKIRAVYVNIGKAISLPVYQI